MPHPHVEKSHDCVVAQIASILPPEGVVALVDCSDCAVIGRIDSVRQVTELHPGPQVLTITT
ncbi:MAG: hypothetical protein WAS49_04185 [Candidatus Dechloromonas phosphoritropha]|nr:hypothetical protein [Azonexus sp.]